MNVINSLNIKNCTTCGWRESKAQAPCAYCGSTYGVYNEYKPNELNED